MRRADFLAKLREEGKLELTEPSENIKSAYIAKSESHLISAKLLLESSRLEESVSMAYYSIYFMLQALLYKTGIKCENHSAAIVLLDKVYALSNADISAAKRERIDKQYYVDFSVTRQETAALIRTAERFNARLLDFLEKLNNEKIGEHRERLNRMIS